MSEWMKISHFIELSWQLPWLLVFFFWHLCRFINSICILYLKTVLVSVWILFQKNTMMKSSYIPSFLRLSVEKQETFLKLAILSVAAILCECYFKPDCFFLCSIHFSWRVWLESFVHENLWKISMYTCATFNV